MPGAMSTRRSRPSRSRKARAPETVATGDVAAPRADATAELARSVDPTQTAQLRALEAGWDELLS